MLLPAALSDLSAAAGDNERPGVCDGDLVASVSVAGRLAMSAVELDGSVAASVGLAFFFFFFLSTPAPLSLRAPPVAAA